MAVLAILLATGLLKYWFDNGFNTHLHHFDGIEVQTVNRQKTDANVAFDTHEFYIFEAAQAHAS